MKFYITECKPTILSLADEDAEFLLYGRYSASFLIKRLPGAIGYEVFADNVVGALRLPSGAQLHIKSKLPLPNIIRMLSYLGNSSLDILPLVDLNHEPELFDLLVSEFSREMGCLLRAGLRRDYSEQIDTLRTIRGRIDFSKSIANGAVYSNRLTCKYSQLSLLSSMNRGLVAAAHSASACDVVSDKNRANLRRCLSMLPEELRNSTFNFAEFKTIQFDRNTVRYERGLFLSELILINLAYSDQDGPLRFSGFLLRMYDLFEKYVAKALHEMNSNQLNVLAQHKTKLDDEGHVNIKPDLTFATRDGIQCVADTKYKDFSSLRFAESDVYQMLAYLVHHKCETGFLIYPAFDSNQAGVIKSITIPSSTGQYKIHAIFVTLTTPDDVAAQISRALSDSNVEFQQPA